MPDAPLSPQEIREALIHLNTTALPGSLNTIWAWDMLRRALHELLERAEDTEMLDWWENHLNFEHGTDYEDGGVTIYKVTGDINDREWHEVSNGLTLREAIRAARKGEHNA